MLPVIIIFAVIIQIIVFYFIIKSASQSSKLVLQNEQIIGYLRAMANSSGASKIDLFNAHSTGIKVKLIESKPEGDIVEVETKWMMYYLDRFDPGTQQKVKEANSSAQFTMNIKYDGLVEALKKKG